MLSEGKSEHMSVCIWICVTYPWKGAPETGGSGCLQGGSWDHGGRRFCRIHLFKDLRFSYVNKLLIQEIDEIFKSRLKRKAGELSEYNCNLRNEGTLIEWGAPRCERKSRWAEQQQRQGDSVTNGQFRFTCFSFTQPGSRLDLSCAVMVMEVVVLNHSLTTAHTARDFLKIVIYAPM
jgi:hypothetical protein